MDRIELLKSISIAEIFENNYNLIVNGHKKRTAVENYKSNSHRKMVVMSVKDNEASRSFPYCQKDIVEVV